MLMKKEIIEDNKRLKQDNDYLNKVNIELSSRNSKAIEYIENKYNGMIIIKEEILSILKGSDKE